MKGGHGRQRRLSGSVRRSSKNGDYSCIATKRSIIAVIDAVSQVLNQCASSYFRGSHPSPRSEPPSPNTAPRPCARPG